MGSDNATKDFEEENTLPEEKEESLAEQDMPEESLESETGLPDILITGAGGMPPTSPSDRSVTLESLEEIAEAALEDVTPIIKLSAPAFQEDISSFVYFQKCLSENKAQNNAYGISAISKMSSQDIKSTHLPDKETLCLTISGSRENNTIYIQDNGKQGLDFFVPHQDMESLNKLAKIAVEYAPPETDFMLSPLQNNAMTNLLEKALIAFAEANPEKSASLNLTLNGKAISKAPKPGVSGL